MIIIPELGRNENYGKKLKLAQAYKCFDFNSAKIQFC